MIKPTLALALFAVGCAGTPDQVVTGRVAPGFPTQVTAVRAVQNGKVIATAPMAADGSFQLAFAPGKHVALQVVTSGKTQLVFPRQAGGLKTTFSARANGAAFDLGSLHFVGNATTAPIVFHNGPASTTECHDGKDASGAVCADDSDDSQGTCDDENENEDENESEADDGADSSDDVDDSLADEGDAIAEHNFPADGCADDEDSGSDD